MTGVGIEALDSPPHDRIREKGIMTTAARSHDRSTRAPLSSFHKVKLAFLVAAFVSFVLSVSLWFFVDHEIGLFVGLWVPAIHSLGTLVLTGEDRS
jgi:hypothetical protein